MSKAKTNEIEIIRLYNAPVNVVWDAWNDPSQAVQWWGPRGFTITHHSKDLKVGGVWSYTMHGPDGKDYPNKTKYLEIEKYSRLVYDHGGNDEREPLFRVRVLFSEASGKTRVQMSMILPTVEAAEETRKMIKKVGGDATWDRLAEYLEKKSSGKEVFVINRSFSTSVGTLFDMWTNTKHFANWMGPTGSTMSYIRAEIKPGGSIFYLMTDSAGTKMYGRSSYIEIKKPQVLIYTQQFCDEKENISRHPMAPTWPETMLTKVSFYEEGNGRARVAVTWEPHGKTTREEMDVFVSARAGMTMGWTGSFDKLEDYLQQI